MTEHDITRKAGVSVLIELVDYFLSQSHGKIRFVMAQMSATLLIRRGANMDTAWNGRVFQTADQIEVKFNHP
jgi:hypothetical protein